MPNLIGTAPNQVPTNGALGNMAFQNKEAVSVDTLVTTALTVTGTGALTVGGTQIVKDASGNVGIGVTPSAWSWGGRVIDGTNNMAISANGNNLITAANAFWNGTAWAYKTTSQATRYEQNAGLHQWYTAASGTANTAITFTEVMRITSAGNVGIGTSSPSNILNAKRDQNATTSILVENASTGVSAAASLGAVSDASSFQIYNYGSGRLTGGSNQYNNGASTVVNYNGVNGLILAACNSAATGSDGISFWTANAGNAVKRMTLDASGNVGIGTSSPSALLDVNADTVRVRTAKTPASATAAGNAGDICWDANYVYVCVATDTWKRSALSTW